MERLPPGNDIEPGSDLAQNCWSGTGSTGGRERLSPVSQPSPEVAEIVAEVALRVEIDKEHSVSGVGEEATEVGRNARLADPPFAIENGDRSVECSTVDRWRHSYRPSGSCVSQCYRNYEDARYPTRRRVATLLPISLAGADAGY